MKMRIDREAYRFDAVILAGIVGMGVLGALVWSGAWYFCLPLLLVLVLVNLFLRETVRDIAFAPGEIVSPASGRIIFIGEAREPEFLDGPALKISIFMSVLDQHINYAPVAGKVDYLRYQEGTFHRAYLDEASESNEAQLIGLTGPGGRKVLIRQVAGVLARRVVCRVRLGDSLRAGQGVGLIRFGSRVDAYLPTDTKLSVAVGAKVAGGLTVLGNLP